MTLMYLVWKLVMFVCLGKSAIIFQKLSNFFASEIIMRCSEWIGVCFVISGFSVLRINQFYMVLKEF